MRRQCTQSTPPRSHLLIVWQRVIRARQWPRHADEPFSMAGAPSTLTHAAERMHVTQQRLDSLLTLSLQCRTGIHTEMGFSANMWRALCLMAHELAHKHAHNTMWAQAIACALYRSRDGRLVKQHGVKCSQHPAHFGPDCGNRKAFIDHSTAMLECTCRRQLHRSKRSPSMSAHESKCTLCALAALAHEIEPFLLDVFRTIHYA